MMYVFDDVIVDTLRYERRQGDTVVPLELQGFKVLGYLLEQRQRVVMKDELLEHLWPGQHVSEATLTQRLVAIRCALGDDGRTQRYIRTVHGRGYRFVAAVTLLPQAFMTPAPPPGPVPQTPSIPRTTPALVGRDTGLQRLHQCFAQTIEGNRQLVFITGEAGIGKTSLICGRRNSHATRESCWGRRPNSLCRLLHRWRG